MRKKVVVALVAAMSLTIAGTGTVFAMNNFHMHGENCEWVVDKEAWDEIVKHPEEGHYETQTIPAWDEIVKHPEEGHYETQKVLVKEAWDETVHHEAIYEDKEVWVIDKAAWDEEVRNPAKDVYELHYFCNGCKKDFGSDANGGYDAVMAHNREQMLAGNTACGGWHDGQVLVEEGYDIVHRPEEGHYETQKVLVKEAWDEIVHHEAIYEDKEVWVVDKEAWEETIHHEAEGHWECEETPDNPDQKPEEPENPEQPENPDQKPEQPENPDVETPDAENPETPEQPEAESPNNQPEADKEETQTPATETQKEETAPKTGDTASALPVAGAGVTSLGIALATILKKRK